MSQDAGGGAGVLAQVQGAEAGERERRAAGRISGLGAAKEVGLDSGPASCLQAVSL